MELLEVYRCPQFTRPVVFTGRFKNVKNAAEIRARLIEAGKRPGRSEEEEDDDDDDTIDFAYINAKLITSPLHLQTAAVQAMFAYYHKNMRTKSLHSEIIWYLNPSNNIKEAFERYGVCDTTTDMILMHISTREREDVLERMQAAVNGELDLVGNVGQVTDWATVIKHYKLDQEPAFQGNIGESAEERAKIENVVVSSVAMKTMLS